MKSSPMATYFLISFSFFFALALLLLPVPESVKLLRPDWVFLALIYWNVYNSDWVGIGWAWCLGLVLDVSYGSVLGVHALIFTLLSYLVLKNQIRIRSFPMWQQVLLLMSLTFVYQLFLVWMQVLLQHTSVNWQYWLTPFLTGILWPWVVYGLSKFRNYYRI